MTIDAKDSPQAAITPFEDYHNYVLPPEGKLKTSNSSYAVLPLWTQSFIQLLTDTKMWIETWVLKDTEFDLFAHVELQADSKFGRVFNNEMKILD